jgi:hypothetical protein
MNKNAEFYRVVVVRTAKGDKQHRLRQPLRRVYRVPVVLDVRPIFDPIFIRRTPSIGFVDVRWDGKETTVSGFPVYR